MKLTIYREVILDDLWGTKEEFDELGENTFLDMIADADPLSIVEEAGGTKASRLRAGTAGGRVRYIL